jgi:hypothetical protein
MAPWCLIETVSFGDVTMGLFHTTEELAGSEGRSTFDLFHNEKYTVEVWIGDDKVFDHRYRREYDALHDFRRMKDRLRARKDGLKPDASNDPAWI